MEQAPSTHTKGSFFYILGLITGVSIYKLFLYSDELSCKSNMFCCNDFFMWEKNKT